MRKYLWGAASLAILCFYLWRAKHLFFSFHPSFLLLDALLYLSAIIQSFPVLNKEYKAQDRSLSWMALYGCLTWFWGTSLLETLEKIWRIKA